MDQLNGTSAALLERNDRTTKDQKKIRESGVKPQPESRANSVTADENQNEDPLSHLDQQPNKESYITMKESEIIVPKLQLLDIKNVRIQNIYNQDMEELKKNVNIGKAILEPKTFKFEMLVCFWVCIHMESLEFAKYIYDQEPLLEKILSNLRKTGAYLIAEKKEKEIKALEDEESRARELKRQAAMQKGGLFGGVFKDKQKQQELDELERNASKRQASLKKMQSIKSDEKGSVGEEEPKSNKKSGKKKVELKLPASKLSAFQEEYIAELEQRKGILNMDDLLDVHWLMKGEAGSTYNTNIMRLALNLQEEKIASLIVAFYDSKIDDEMVLRAVKTQQINFIYSMFVYNKNYEELMSRRKFEKLVQAAMQSADQEPEAVKALESARFKVFTLDYVIKKVLDYGEERGLELVDNIAKWGLKSSENILKALLKNNMDDVAERHVLTYIDYADQELLSFCILNNNEKFLKFCMKQGIFSTRTLGSSELIDEILNIFKTGSKTELILNVLMYMNLLQWSRKQIKKFVDQLSLIVFENHEKNPITISYNPILIISLSCEQLLFIEDNFISIKHECKIVRTRMLFLGDKILDNFDDEKLQKVFLDTDFKDRTLLKIITMNKFDKLFENYKVSVILEEIWQGKFTFECDGEIRDLSLLTHLINSPIKRIKNQRLDFSSLIFNGFSYESFKDQKYWFQYKFRSTSISYIFQKDLASAFIMTIIFQMINFTYLDLFKEERFYGFSKLGRMAYIEDCIKEYNRINFLGSIFSSALVFHLFEKIIFNAFAYKKLLFDTWTFIDLLSACLNLFCFNVIGNVKADQIDDRVQKEFLNYYVICVTIVCWLRFFGYFLMIRIISKLMHTLNRMVKDTVAFIFLMICYFMIMATIFTMLFQVPDSDRFGTIPITLRTLFNALGGNYEYLDDQPQFQLSFQILMIFHVFMSNIFLLNYLVAILSTVFVIMTEYGEFEYRCNKYEFIEKYSTPMLDKDGYKELVIHPPPLNFLTVPVIFGSFSKDCMRGFGNCFSKLIFWLENVPFIFVFLFYEISLIPLAYFKQILNFTAKSTWKNFFFLIPFWLIFGIPICLVLGVFGDLSNFFAVLCDYKLKDEEEKQRVEDDHSKDRVILYNELMDVMRAIMHIYKKRDEEEKGRRQKLLKTLQKKQAKGGASGAQAAADFLDQFFIAQDMENQGYILEKHLIKQAWAKYRPESAAPSPREGQEQQEKDRSDLNQVFGQVFIEKLLKSVKNRLYRGRKMFDYEERKRKHKLNQKSKKAEQDDVDDEVQFRNDFLAIEHRMIDEDPLKTRDIPATELQMVDDFLNKFIFIGQGTVSKSQIDINLVLKSLPARIDPLNLYRVDMLGFSVIQKSLIAFQNDDQDELFVHYDDRTKQRLRKLNINVTDTEGMAEGLKDVSYKILELINRWVKMAASKDGGREEEDDDGRGSRKSSRGGSGRRSRHKREGDGGSKEGERPRNPYDDIVIESEYTRQLKDRMKDGIDIYKRKPSKTKQRKDLGGIENDQQAYDRLQMYLPQNLKLPPGLLKGDNRVNLAPQGPKHNYVKDYAEQESLHVKRIYRASGVNFRVDLHKERTGGIKDSPSKSKKNLKIVSEKLQKAGVNDELLKELLKENSSSVSPKRQGKAYMQDLNKISKLPKNLSGIGTPLKHDNSAAQIFSDNDYEDPNIINADLNNLSPLTHKRANFNKRLPKDELSFMTDELNGYVAIQDQDRFTFKKQAPSGHDTRIDFKGEHTIPEEDRKLLNNQAFKIPRQSKQTNYDDTDDDDIRNKPKQQIPPPKGPANSNFKPIYD